MNHETSLSLFVLLLAGVGVALLISCIPVPASEVCLSKREARHLWPRQHIYWYSSDHCWSNRRGGPPRHLKIEPDEPKPKKIKGDPVFNQIRAEEKPAPPRMAAPLRSDQPMDIVTDGCCWPVLTEFDYRFVGVQP